MYLSIPDTNTSSNGLNGCGLQVNITLYQSISELTAALKGNCLFLAYDIEYRQEFSLMVNNGRDVSYNTYTNSRHDGCF